ncbi:MAG: M48 family metallopeptidase [candidate division WOR-3 bacterium]|nr:M48 family metallopeptidase [candidate division WOR-3 bacterium]
MNKHRIWIKKKQIFIENTLLSAKNKKLVKRNEIQFKNIVYDLVGTNSQYLKVKVNKIFFRKMRTKWASLSSNRNMTINMLMRYLPKYLINYIITHELTHIVEKRHSEKFWNIISKRFANYCGLEKELFEFWFLIQKINS